MSTHPNEAYPTDAGVEGLDGTVDEPTGLAYIAKGVGPSSSPSYEVQYNRRLHRQNSILAALRQGMVVDEGGLRIGVYPIRYTLGGQRKVFDGATNQAVPDNATHKVYLDNANTLQIQADFPDTLETFLPLATVTAANGVLILVDERPSVLFCVPGA